MNMRAVVATLALAGALGAQNFPDAYYYRFDEGAGKNVINWANAANAPTFNGNLGGIWDSASPQVGSSSMNFSGLDFLRCNGGVDTSQSYTIEMWVRTNYTTTTIGRLWGDYSIGLFRCYLAFANTGVNYYGGNIAPNMNLSAAVINDLQWHHIALVFDATAGTVSSYVDGALDQQQAANPGGVGTDLQLGGRLGVSPIFNGSVDEFRVWRSARSQADILANMNTTLVSPNITAAFGSNATAGSSPLLVSFHDFSETPNGSINSWAWDVDGDAIVDYTNQNPCHVYTTSGTYNVTLTVTDTMGGSHTTTLTNYITVGSPDFVMWTCGTGDLYLGAPTPPLGWFDGFTLISASQPGPLGAGWFFGLYPDGFTWAGVSYPPAPGNPLHFVNVGLPSLFPESPLSFPSGTFTPGSGLTFDAVIVYRDAFGGIINYTGAARIGF